MSLITIFDKHCVLRNILFGEIYIYKVLQTFVCRFSMKHKKVSHVKNLTNYIFLFWSLQYRDNSDHLCFSRFRLFHGQLISEIIVLSAIRYQPVWQQQPMQAQSTTKLCQINLCIHNVDIGTYYILTISNILSDNDE